MLNHTLNHLRPANSIQIFILGIGNVVQQIEGLPGKHKVQRYIPESCKPVKDVISALGAVGKNTRSPRSLPTA